jgi:hypothetical protein
MVRRSVSQFDGCEEAIAESMADEQALEMAAIRPPGHTQARSAA